MGAYTTTLPRAAMRMAAGIVAGATLVALWSLVGKTKFDTVLFRGALVVFAYAEVIWAAGLIVVAAVPGAILHHYDCRGWPVTFGFGAILTFIFVSGFLINGFGAYTGPGNFSVSDCGGPAYA